MENGTFKTIFVTIGTTRFDGLIHEITSERVMQVLKRRGCEKLILQYGNGQAVNAQHIKDRYDINVDQYMFKTEAERTDMKKADLVIGHGGAGTCVDILSYRKPGLVVINEQLMDNHQTELAIKLSKKGYIFYSYLDSLAAKLDSLNVNELQTWPEENNMKDLISYLNTIMVAE